MVPAVCMALIVVSRFPWSKYVAFVFFVVCSCSSWTSDFVVHGVHSGFELAVSQLLSGPVLAVSLGPKDPVKS